MNIAMFTDFYFPTLGGVQTSIKSQKEALEALGHKVLVFCPNPPHGDKTVIQLPTISFVTLGGIPLAGPFKKVTDRAKKALLRHGDIDVIHSHTSLPVGIAGLVLAKDLGLPAVQTMHGRDDVFAQKTLPFPELLSIVPAFVHSRYLPHKELTSAGYKKLARTATARRMWRLMVNHANAADHIIVPSKHFAQKLQLAGVIRPLSIVSNAIEDSVWLGISDIRPRLYTGKRALKIMWCSRLSPEKRLLDFLTSIAILKGKVAVDVYGDGTELKKGRYFVDSHNLDKVVTFHGSVSQSTILEEMLNHDVLAFTSYDFDNQPMVLLEAVAAGLPVIFCDPDMKEFLPPGGSILTATPSAQSIAEAVRLLLKDPKRIQAMSQDMLDHRDVLKQSKQVEHLLSVYRRAISGRSTALTPAA